MLGGWELKCLLPHWPNYCIGVNCHVYELSQRMLCVKQSHLRSMVETLKSAYKVNVTQHETVAENHTPSLYQSNMARFESSFATVIISSFREIAGVLGQIMLRDYNKYTLHTSVTENNRSLSLAHKISIADIPSQQATFLIDIQACKFFLFWGLWALEFFDGSSASIWKTSQEWIWRTTCRGF